VLEQRLRALVRADPWRMAVLEAARDLALPGWAVGAGFLRSAVWDHLHGYAERSPLADIDLLFFDPADVSPEREAAAESRLGEQAAGGLWEVRNQARMHLLHGHRPYRDLEDGLRHWLETATAVALRLEPDDAMTVIAPFGLADLFALRSRPTDEGRARPGDYLARMHSKDWPRRWPQVRVEGLNA
jgi:hypothetical protein